MPATHLVLGLDGADLDVVRALGAETLPSLHGLMRRGAFAPLESVLPFATLPNWTTFLTGVDPGRHGVFDFTLMVDDKVRFVGGTVRASPTVFRGLDALGKQVAVLFFPATYPPEALAHGLFVSGWDSPVAFEADASFVHPPALHAELLDRFGRLRFDDVDEFDADRPSFHDALSVALVRRVDRKVELARHLLATRSFDAFALYFGELDTASHHLFAHHDPASPRHPGSSRASSGLREVYAAVDAAVGAVLRAAGGDTVEVTVVSDHGSGGTSDVVVYLNRALADAGLLTFGNSTRARGLGALKDVALTWLTPAARERIFRAFGGALPSWLESRARFAAFDRTRTVAYSEELSYFPSVRVARGLEGATREAALRRATATLLALRNPFTDAPIVAAVHRRESLFEGPHVERAPELVLELALDGAYSYNLARSVGAGPVCERLPRSEHVGRKGRSLPGGHRRHGLYVAAGPSIAPVGEVQAGIADATATLLARMGIAPPQDAKGRVLFEVLASEVGATPLPNVPGSTQCSRGDEAAVERRLRALGYVE